MGKRKDFAKTDINIPHVAHSRNKEGNLTVFPDTIPPKKTKVEFGRSACRGRSFDFSRWYGVSIDTITYSCQRQIERFLADQDARITITTVVSYCTNGLRNFLEYCMLRASAVDRELTLKDVDRDLIDGYISFLAEKGLKTTSQKSLYTHTKSVLVALGRRSLIPIVNAGDEATFPHNPFPNYNRKAKGETALSLRERKDFTVALRLAIKPIWSDDALPTSKLLAFALLAIALHTGRNTTPLLEMTRDCLRSHPKDNLLFLVLWKRRGYSTSKATLRSETNTERLLESTPTVRTNIEQLIRRILTLTAPLVDEAPSDLRDRAWLYRSRAYKNLGEISVLTDETLAWAANCIVTEHALTDSDGRPLRINVSRLRKTFANRIFELTDADLATTAAALGNTPKVAEQNYLKPSENARRNWRFLGEVLVQELLSQTIGASYKETPMGHCADPVSGQYAPKRKGATCMCFTNCLRCKHYAVTAEDLYKLFSFYFRVLKERGRMSKRRWGREYAHIPRLIDHYIVAEGLQRGCFDRTSIEAARDRARTEPHPFWSVEFLDSLEVFE